MTLIPPGLRVYIVEDSAILLNLLVAVVESADAEVVGTSDNAERAIRELPGLKADLILLDIALRSGTGFDVLRALQSCGNAAPVSRVVLTNYTTTEYRRNSFRLGATHFFDKSSECSHAIALITKLAAARRTGRARADREQREPNGHH
jgi:DNA-binding NarL/FixJ family response regulator